MSSHPLVEGLELRKLLDGDAADTSAAGAALLAPPQSILADLNGDGRADEITVIHNSNAFNTVIRVGLGVGNGVFAPSDSIGLNYNTAVAVAAGDLNGDGLVDVSVAGQNPLAASPANTGATVVTFLGDGHGGFKRTPASTTNAEPQPVTFTTFVPQVIAVHGLVVGDLDGTPSGDIAVLGQLRTSNAPPPTNSAGTPAANTATGVVAVWDPTLPTLVAIPPTVVTFPALTSVDRLFAGDLDGDGHLDLVAARATPQPPSPLAVVRPDLVTVHFSSTRIATTRAGLNPLYLVNATPSPTAANALPTTFGLDDVTGDHVPDLVGSAGPTAIRYSSFSRASATGAAGGAFSPAKTAVSIGLPPMIALRAHRLADINGDGLADVLADSSSGRLLGLNVTGHSPVASAANLVTFAWSRVFLTPNFTADLTPGSSATTDTDILPTKKRDVVIL